VRLGKDWQRIANR
jgi:hypothetical protein